MPGLHLLTHIQPLDPPHPQQIGFNAGGDRVVVCVLAAAVAAAAGCKAARVVLFPPPQHIRRTSSTRADDEARARRRHPRRHYLRQRVRRFFSSFCLRFQIHRPGRQRQHQRSSSLPPPTRLRTATMSAPTRSGSGSGAIALHHVPSYKRPSCALGVLMTGVRAFVALIGSLLLPRRINKFLYTNVYICTHHRHHHHHHHQYLDKWDPNAYVKKVKRRFIVLTHESVHWCVLSIPVCVCVSCASPPYPLNHFFPPPNTHNQV